jgi:hypothetical protein
MHAKAQALLELQLHFIRQQCANPEHIKSEVLGFFNWLAQQPISQLWSAAPIQALLQQQILSHPTSTALINQIQSHIALALQHPLNQNTTIEDVIPVECVDQLAQYLAAKQQQRQALIKHIVNNSHYIQLVSNLIQQSLSDYFEHSVKQHKIPGVSSFMKMGKSVIELAADRSLEQTINQYLQKNISKISQLSEKLLNHQLDEDKVYHWQAQLWHRIKKTPLSQLQRYVLIHDLPQTVAIGTEFWQHFKHTAYAQQQLQDGVAAWFAQQQHASFGNLLQQLNINHDLLNNELYALMMPILQQLLEDGYVLARIESYLQQFYASEQVTAILTAP